MPDATDMSTSTAGTAGIGIPPAANGSMLAPPVLHWPASTRLGLWGRRDGPNSMVEAMHSEWPEATRYTLACRIADWADPGRDIAASAVAAWDTRASAAATTNMLS